MNNKKAYVQTHVYLSPAQREALGKAADARGLSVAAFIREAISTHANRLGTDYPAEDIGEQGPHGKGRRKPRVVITNARHAAHMAAYAERVGREFREFAPTATAQQIEAETVRALDQFWTEVEYEFDPQKNRSAFVEAFNRGYGDRE